MTDIRKLGRNLLLAFSIAGAGYGIYGGISGAAYELGTDNYATANACENKIGAGQPCSQQELKSLVNVKHNETKEGKGLAILTLSSLGALAARRKKLTIQPELKFSQN